MENDNKTINIRPTTAVYKTFERYNYTQSTAYAEFIDNSTQSFFDHCSELEQDELFNCCTIDIHHDALKNTIEIMDNCYGMELEDFKRAIILNSAPDVTTGRNEFGMGLKAAASWFGRKWTVRSTMMGSTNEYVATVNTEELARTKEATIPLKVNKVLPGSHYTLITIENVIRDYPRNRSLGKLRQDIGGIYRRDIGNKRVVIRYNDEKLSYSAPPILEAEDKNGVRRIWKKELDYTVPYKGETYTVKGFVAIREKASTEHAGLTLFRRDRVIIGGFSGTYRPKEIFGQSNSYAYQRLFGEINLDNWPVSQAKDKFTWGEELEGLFKQSINDRIGDLKIQAQNYRARTAKEKNADENVARPPSPVVPVDSYRTSMPSSPSKKPVSVPPVALVQKPLEIPVTESKPLESSTGQIVPSFEHFSDSDTRNYRVRISTEESYDFRVSFKNLAGSTVLFTKSSDKNLFNIFINLSHPMAVRAQASQGSMGTLVEMVIFLALSEKKIESDSSIGSIGADSVRQQLNELAYNDLEEVRRCG